MGIERLESLLHVAGVVATRLTVDSNTQNWPYAVRLKSNSQNGSMLISCFYQDVTSAVIPFSIIANIPE